MTKIDKWEWIAPIFLVIGIFAIYLALTYLPLATWGITFPTGSLWNYMPWIVVLGVVAGVMKN